jgi:hypothetical protein
MAVISHRDITKYGVADKWAVSVGGTGTGCQISGDKLNLIGNRREPGSGTAYSAEYTAFSARSDSLIS